jgi:hypothetical protein
VKREAPWAVGQIHFGNFRSRCCPATKRSCGKPVHPPAFASQPAMPTRDNPYHITRHSARGCSIFPSVRNTRQTRVGVLRIEGKLLHPPLAPRLRPGRHGDRGSVGAGPQPGGAVDCGRAGACARAERAWEWARGCGCLRKSAPAVWKKTGKGLLASKLRSPTFVR